MLYKRIGTEHIIDQRFSNWSSYPKESKKQLAQRKKKKKNLRTFFFMLSHKTSDAECTEGPRTPSEWVRRSAMAKCLRTTPIDHQRDVGGGSAIILKE